MHAIEHVTKDDGLRLLSKLEEIARRQVIIATPVGFLASGSNHETLATHRSGWTIEEFKQRGYSIRGYALAIRVGEDVCHPGCLLKYILLFVTYFLGPLVYFIPSKAINMVCVKKIT
ncbi:hypothetical protein HKBW3S09_01681 [Candidatus Hakubella thermalkaliphila]|uniref:Methyltransferase type 11 domain-containing protein n=1 Tax=Candidatus Hakubella thermalkaliphila TaxID=2754717 RepID=A0A6V8NXM6_9ACTN|nr:hypothetical protein HKBW3S09_01681 [Candidatus Hakubella thermalkaliphila]